MRYYSADEKKESALWTVGVVDLHVLRHSRFRGFRAYLFLAANQLRSRSHQPIKERPNLTGADHDCSLATSQQQLVVTHFKEQIIRHANGIGRFRLGCLRSSLFFAFFATGLEEDLKYLIPALLYLFVGQIGTSDRSYSELWLSIAHRFPLQASFHG